MYSMAPWRFDCFSPQFTCLPLGFFIWPFLLSLHVQINAPTFLTCQPGTPAILLIFLSVCTGVLGMSPAEFTSVNSHQLDVCGPKLVPPPPDACSRSSSCQPRIKTNVKEAASMETTWQSIVEMGLGKNKLIFERFPKWLAGKPRCWQKQWWCLHFEIPIPHSNTFTSFLYLFSCLLYLPISFQLQWLPRSCAIIQKY